MNVSGEDQEERREADQNECQAQAALRCCFAPRLGEFAASGSGDPEENYSGDDLQARCQDHAGGPYE